MLLFFFSLKGKLNLKQELKCSSFKCSLRTHHCVFQTLCKACEACLCLLLMENPQQCERTIELYGMCINFDDKCLTPSSEDY